MIWKDHSAKQPDETSVEGILGMKNNILNFRFRVHSLSETK